MEAGQAKAGSPSSSRAAAGWAKLDDDDDDDTAGRGASAPSALCRACCGGEREERGWPAGVIKETDPIKERWDGLIVLCILYSAVVVPWRLCFRAEALGGMWAFEAGMSVVFLLVRRGSNAAPRLRVQSPRHVAAAAHLAPHPTPLRTCYFPSIRRTYSKASGCRTAGGSPAGDNATPRVPTCAR